MGSSSSVPATVSEMATGETTGTAVVAETAAGDTTRSVEPEKKSCKACCACPETKRERDACIVEHGEENCKSLIEAHRECMKKMGFNI